MVQLSPPPIYQVTPSLDWSQSHRNHRSPPPPPPFCLLPPQSSSWVFVQPFWKQTWEVVRLVLRFASGEVGSSSELNGVDVTFW